ncbi:MAG: hypothetical protein GXO09_03980 [Crenarchaeota archaeon]|nr:hypothetical protein [Thermoproteota archaeon]
MSVVVSVRVPRRVKEILERHGVNVGELVRRVLIEEAERLEDERVWRELEEAAGRLRGVFDEEEWARVVDEERRAR